MNLPRLVVIDDLFGRVVPERRNLCKAYRLIDVTGDDMAAISIDKPIAQAVFCSAQRLASDRIDNSVDIALDVVHRGWPTAEGARWALCLLDLRFVSGTVLNDGTPGGSTGDDDFGLMVLRELQHKLPDLPVVILSSRERAEVIEECRRLGASDFIQRHVVGASEPPHAVLAQKLRDFGLIEDSRGVIVGRSVALLRALASARRAATGSGNVLLLGETGSGKELVARYLHDNSPRASGPYRVFEEFGTAESLQEDKLFGHVRGAFTGANKDRAGLFEEANGGTLFVDEVGDISEGLQNRLLRPIESRIVSRQGSNEEIRVSVQLVLATNKALDEHARTGRFKVDLLNRINAYTINLPPLRERRDDIPLLAVRLLEGLCVENGVRWPRHIDGVAMQQLVAHDWREGNVRQLRSVLERAIKNNPDAEIVVASDLSLKLPSEFGDDKSEPDHLVAGITKEEQRDATIVPVLSYEDLYGSWESLQRDVAIQLGKYLASALQVTALRRARDGKARANLAGAVGCLLGRKATTIEAVDFVRRLRRFNGPVMEELCASQPLLKDAFVQADEARKRRPGKDSISKRSTA